MSDPNDIALDVLVTALLREHLVRHGHTKTLAAFDLEHPRGTHSLSSRSALAKQLKLHKLIHVNRKRQEPLGSMLEMIAHCLHTNSWCLKVCPWAVSAAPREDVGCWVV